MPETPSEPPEDDPLELLRERIAATEEAARRLAGETAEARRAATESGVPPAGWQTPEEHAERNSEVQALVVLLEAIRDLIPEELKEQFRELVRQLLLLVRALIDWWVERIDGRSSGSSGDGGPAVEEIPVD
jgi:hypothetical protein